MSPLLAAAPPIVSALRVRGVHAMPRIPQAGRCSPLPAVWGSGNAEGRPSYSQPGGDVLLACPLLMLPLYLLPAPLTAAAGNHLGTVGGIQASQVNKAFGVVRAAVPGLACTAAELLGVPCCVLVGAALHPAAACLIPAFRPAPPAPLSNRPCS